MKRNEQILGENQSFTQTLSKLPADLRQLLPENSLTYLLQTNEMHCNPNKPGGSKFTEVGNILEVLLKDASRIAEKIKQRQDDRDALIAAGASEHAFLPATKNENHPATLPEALYYKIDGVKGKLNIIQLKNLNPNTKIIIRREKSLLNSQGQEKSPCSFSVVFPNDTKSPKIDFATIIIGRAESEPRKDTLWTIHPGVPIKPIENDFIPGSESLPPPIEGKKQKVIIITAAELLATKQFQPDDYIKIIINDENKILSQYEQLSPSKK
jgi:hypothetical protein